MRKSNLCLTFKSSNTAGFISRGTGVCQLQTALTSTDSLLPWLHPSLCTPQPSPGMESRGQEPCRLPSPPSPLSLPQFLRTPQTPNTLFFQVLSVSFPSPSAPRNSLSTSGNSHYAQHCHPHLLTSMLTPFTEVPSHEGTLPVPTLTTWPVGGWSGAMCFNANYWSSRSG